MTTWTKELTKQALALKPEDRIELAETPKLAPWFGEMQKRLAETLGVEPGRVSVKAKSPEGLGVLGREEGVAAMAVVSVEVSE